MVSQMTLTCWYVFVALATAEWLPAKKTPSPSVDTIKYPPREVRLAGTAPFPTAPATSTLATSIESLSCSVSEYTSSEMLDESFTASCICNNGETRDLAPSTASDWQPCPPTSRPQTITVTSGAQYPFTTTFYPIEGLSTYGTVVACESASAMDIDGEPPLTMESSPVAQRRLLSNLAGNRPLMEIQCVGPRVTISADPRPSMHALVASDTSVYVGQCTAAALSANITSALRSICPSPVPASVAPSCTQSWAAIEPIDYPGYGGDCYADEWLCPGTLNMTLESWIIADGDMYEKFINSVASLAAQTTNGSCFTEKYESAHDLRPVESETACNVAAQLLLQYYDGVSTDGPTNQLWLGFNFIAPDLGGEGESVEMALCEDIAKAGFAAAEIFAFVLPEVALPADEVLEIVDVACEAGVAIQNAQANDGSGDDSLG